jgi:acetyl esterase/lipase
MPVSFSQIPGLPYTAAQRKIRYGDAPSQVGQLWLPRSSDRAAPLVVFFHGGCWLKEYAADHVFPLASQLTADGFAVWVPEYRRVGEDGGGWPGSFEDVRASLARVAALALPAIDYRRVLLAGHSAGGHLALWLAAQQRESESVGMTLRGAVGLAAITDLRAYASGDNSCEQVTTRFMGGPPETLSDRYRLASPAALPVAVPTVLLRGTLDGIVPGGQLETFPDSPLLERRTLAGAGHFDWIHPQTAAYGLFREFAVRMLADAEDSL